MPNRYRVASAPAGWPDNLPFAVQTTDGRYEVGDEFEHEFSEEEERENLDSGLLVLLPRRYRIVGESDVFETPPGEEFERAIPLGQERLLFAGGHIERVEPEPEPAKPQKRTTKKATGG